MESLVALPVWYTRLWKLNTAGEEQGNRHERKGCEFLKSLMKKIWGSRSMYHLFTLVRFHQSLHAEFLVADDYLDMVAVPEYPFLVCEQAQLKCQPGKLIASAAPSVPLSCSLVSCKGHDRQSQLSLLQFSISLQHCALLLRLVVCHTNWTGSSPYKSRKVAENSSTRSLNTSGQVSCGTDSG